MSANKVRPTLTRGVAKVPVIMQLEALECGAASLAMVMAYYGKWVPLEQVRLDCGVSRDGSKASNIYRAAVNYGFESRDNYLTQVLAIEDYEHLRVWFFEKMNAACSAIRDRREKQSETAVTKAKNYIQEHYGFDISLDDVSREVNISPYYFSKLFKEESGENFIEYLTRTRIEKAKELLREGNLSIKEISSLVGYADPNYFSRLFKKQTEMTPREYRERNNV